MTRIGRRGARPGSLSATGWMLLLLMLGGVGEASAQRASTSGGRPLEVGGKLGIELDSDGLVLGAQARMAVDPWRRVELMPSYELTFLSGLTERQFNGDLVIAIDARRSTYVGGGVAILDSRFSIDEGGTQFGDRESRTGYSLLAGLHGGSFAGGLVTQIEVRWTKVDDLSPLKFTLGFNYPIRFGGP